MSTTSKTELATILKAAGPKNRKKLRWIIGAIVVIAVIGWFGWSQKAKAQTKTVPYDTEPLSRSDIKLTVTATGTLEPTNEVTIGSELSGTVLEVFVDINDHVTKGQALARLDTAKLTQTTESARANLRSAQASVAEAQATVKETAAALARSEELRKLSEGRLPSQADYDSAVAAADRAKASLLTAEASVAQAQASIRSYETDLSKGVIRSPIDGIVLTRAVEPGQTVAASFTAPELFVIAEKLEHMKLKIAVAEADIGRLASGQKARFTVDAWPDRSYSASVLRVSYGSSITNNVVTYETELEVTNEDLSLRPGMTATAEISVVEANGVFAVPAAALRFDPAASAALAPTAAKKSFVQSLTPMPPRVQKTSRKDAAPAAGAGNARVWVLRNDVPEAIPVRLGVTDGRKTEVIGEKLTEGMQIIVRAR